MKAWMIIPYLLFSYYQKRVFFFFFKKQKINDTLLQIYSMFFHIIPSHLKFNNTSFILHTYETKVWLISILMKIKEGLKLMIIFQV